MHGARARRLVLAAAGLGVVCACAATPADAAGSPGEATPEARRARELGLADHPRWRALLQLGTGGRSRVLEADFFFAEGGARDPEAELLATLEALQTPVDPAASGDDAHPRCRFPARTRFLEAHLSLPPPRTAPRCPALARWRRSLGRVRATLIFPEAFLGNPASLFGHTLLRLDPADSDPEASPEGRDLLAFALDFTADARGDQGLLYALRGLAGGYVGRFSLRPYYEKLVVYADWQDRDIWEYPLPLDESELEWVLLHLWELGDAGFRYFFFTRNCSDLLVRLLQVAWPEIGRGGGMPPAVIPADTVRAILDRAEEEAPRRPPRRRDSPSRQLRERMAGLGAGDRGRVRRLADGDLAPEAPELAALPPARRARVLELAYDLLRYRFLAGQVDDASSRSLSRALLSARSRVERPPEAPALFPPPRGRGHPPNQGHGTATVSLAGGLQDRDAYVELAFRPAFHTLLDRQAGYAPGAQIRVLDTRLRWLPAHDRVRLHELVLLDVVAASPWEPPFRPLAWRFDLGARTRLVSDSDSEDLDTETTYRGEGGAGMALAPFPGAILHVTAGAFLEAGAALERDVGLGPSLRAELAASVPGDRYRARLETRVAGIAAPVPSLWLSARLSQRLVLSRQHALVLDAAVEHALENTWIEGGLRWQVHF